MEAMQALTIIRALADGVNPQTGEVLSEDDPLQHPQTARALFLAVRALERWEERQKREQRLPANAGKPWDPEEDARLRLEAVQGTAIRELARTHARTLGALQSRLGLLGLLPAAPPAQVI